MRYYMAPLEGITDSIYRRLHHKYFPGADRYYTPFFSPTIHRALTPREARELPRADELGVEIIPQLLTKNSEDFIWMTKVCKDLGYREINLNLGCPSGTVTAKGKGSGMLREPDNLKQFLDEIYAGSCLPVSIKTRLGFTDREEFYPLLELFNNYPVQELTIHPRVRQDFYSGTVDKEMFRYAVDHSNSPLCFNGNINTRHEIAAISHEFLEISAVMIGRGLVGDPGMLSPGGTTRDALIGFLEELMAEYTAAFGGSRNAMFRLKENWRYLFCLFQPDSKLQKRLRKATDLQEYKSVTGEILHQLPMQSQLHPDW